MVENAKRLKRGFITEKDISTTLQRYHATTVLALLQEVARVQDEKLDWNAMVETTSTGISNAREYQMLWRHLAYRKSLEERLDNEGEPLDDDSDLDYELEALPTIAPEVSAEAVACVKVLIASGIPSNSTLPSGSTVEAPLTINVPVGQSTRAPSDSSLPCNLVHGTNITIPVSVQKLPAVTSAEGLDTNGLANGNLPPRRKRKPWSAAEDLELIAAVKKCGEGNWANILKGDFKSERSASQLSQRWNIIRKRKGNSNLGGGSQLSEAQLAARRAVSLALNMPMTDKLKASSFPAGTSSAIIPSNSIHPAGGGTSVTGIKLEPQSEQDSLPTATQRSEIIFPSSKQDSVAASTQRSSTLVPSAKSRVNLRAPSTKSIPGPDELVKAAAKAAAKAAGARIATPSDAASLCKAAQAKNAVHIMPGGGSMMKVSKSTGANALSSNVHYIRTGLVTSTFSCVPPNASRSASSQLSQVHSVKPAVPTIQNNPRQTSLKLASKAATPSPVHEVVTKSSDSSVHALKEFAQDEKAHKKANTMKEKVQEQTAFSGISQQGQGQEGDNGVEEQINDNQASISGNTQLGLIENFIKPDQGMCSAIALALIDNHTFNDNQLIEECGITNDNHMVADSCGDDKNIHMGIGQNHKVDKKTDGPILMDTCVNLGEYVTQEDITSMFVVRSDEQGVLGSETTTDAMDDDTKEDKKVVGVEVIL